jgi:hypothetical protein
MIKRAQTGRHARSPDEVDDKDGPHDVVRRVGHPRAPLPEVLHEEARARVHKQAGEEEAREHVDHQACRDTATVVMRRRLLACIIAEQNYQPIAGALCQTLWKPLCQLLCQPSCALSVADAGVGRAHQQYR